MIMRLLFDKEVIVNKYKVAISSLAYASLLCVILRYALRIVNDGHNFLTADWLINYEGGLVRRGLIGQVLYEISGFSISLLWCTFVLQTLFYLLITYFVI